MACNLLQKGQQQKRQQGEMAAILVSRMDTVKKKAVWFCSNDWLMESDTSVSSKRGGRDHLKELTVVVRTFHQCGGQSSKSRRKFQFSSSHHQKSVTSSKTGLKNQQRRTRDNGQSIKDRWLVSSAATAAAYLRREHGGLETGQEKTK